MKQKKSLLYRVLLWSLLGLVLAVAGMLAFRAYQLGWFGKNPEESAPESGESAQPSLLELGNGLSLMKVLSMTGAFYEDGTNEPVERVMTVLLENRGGETVQSAELVLNGTYRFVLNDLPPGECLYVLEKGRQSCPEGLVISSAELSTLSFYGTRPELMEEMLSFEADENGITVRNKSAETLFAGGTLYYKNVYKGCLLGGISYTLTLPPLMPGESTVLSGAARLGAGCRPLFILPAE